MRTIVLYASLGEGVLTWQYSPCQPQPCTFSEGNIGTQAVGRPCHIPFLNPGHSHVDNWGYIEVSTTEHYKAHREVTKEVFLYSSLVSNFPNWVLHDLTYFSQITNLNELSYWIRQMNKNYIKTATYRCYWHSVSPQRGVPSLMIKYSFGKCILFY